MAALETKEPAKAAAILPAYADEYLAIPPAAKPGPEDATAEPADGKSPTDLPLAGPTVTLNVGGKTVTTTRATLMRFPESAFAQALVRHGESKEPLFLDINFKRFQPLLDFMRTLDVASIKREYANDATICSDAVLYNLQPLARGIRTRYPRCMHCHASAIDKVPYCHRAKPLYDHCHNGTVVVAFFPSSTPSSKPGAKASAKPSAKPGKALLLQLCDVGSKEINAYTLAVVRPYDMETHRLPEADTLDVLGRAAEIHMVMQEEKDSEAARKRRCWVVEHPVYVSFRDIVGVIQCGFPGCTLDRPSCPGEHAWIKPHFTNSNAC